MQLDGYLVQHPMREIEDNDEFMWKDVQLQT